MYNYIFTFLITLKKEFVRFCGGHFSFIRLFVGGCFTSIRKTNNNSDSLLILDVI